MSGWGVNVWGGGGGREGYVNYRGGGMGAGMRGGLVVGVEARPSLVKILLHSGITRPLTFDV